MSDNRQNMDTLLGRLVIEQGLASEADVEQCLTAMRDQSTAGDAAGARANQQSLASVLVAQGVVTQRQIERLRPALDETRPAQQIPGYQIVSKLGAGAMATVYKARQLSLDRMVAIKILPRKHTNNAEFVERFYAEGKAAAKLNHANIVQAYDVGKAGDFHYFVMEYVEGRTVYDDIGEGKPYSEKQALDFIIQISKALDHAHKAGFIHRDVKPKNIMITPEGHAKLADMGLARAVTDREAAEAEAGKAYGTPYYISPEQIRGERDIDFRADIYSLGATFYHMVTGQVPFEGPNPSAVMHKHLKSNLVPPDHINPSLSAGIGEVIEVCMAKDKNQRYSTTEDLLEDLKAIARGEPPLQARRKFDLGSLAALEDSAVDTTEAAAIAAGAAAVKPARPLLEQPAFWAAVAGWMVALILLILNILT